jgi:hypothetical protein
MDPDKWAEEYLYDDDDNAFYGYDEYGFPFESEEEATKYEFVNEYKNHLYNAAENIGAIKKDLESYASLANVLLVNGLRKEAPFYTGNLMLNGILSDKINSTSYDITILAPGQVDRKGKKLPDYGWQTDMLSRLRFYTVDGEFIDVPNKNKGWVQRAVYSTLVDLLAISKKRGV